MSVIWHKNVITYMAKLAQEVGFSETDVELITGKTGDKGGLERASLQIPGVKNGLNVQKDLFRIFYFLSRKYENRRYQIGVKSSCNTYRFLICERSTVNKAYRRFLDI